MEKRAKGAAGRDAAKAPTKRDERVVTAADAREAGAMRAWPAIGTKAVMVLKTVMLVGVVGLGRWVRDAREEVGGEVVRHELNKGLKLACLDGDLIHRWEKL